jgi:hypothetical protein
MHIQLSIIASLQVIKMNRVDLYGISTRKSPKFMSWLQKDPLVYLTVGIYVPYINIDLLRVKHV